MPQRASEGAEILPGVKGTVNYAEIYCRYKSYCVE